MVTVQSEEFLENDGASGNLCWKGATEWTWGSIKPERNPQGKFNRNFKSLMYYQVRSVPTTPKNQMKMEKLCHSELSKGTDSLGMHIFPFPVCSPMRESGTVSVNFIKTKWAYYRLYTSSYSTCQDFIFKWWNKINSEFYESYFQVLPGATWVQKAYREFIL